MRYYEIILEAIDYELTAKNWGPNLRKRLKRDPTFEHGPFNQFLLDNDKISDLDLIKIISEFDPTKKKTYLLNWILPRYINGGINQWEDLIGIKEDLELFDRNKHLMPQKDIVQIKTAGELSQMIRNTLRPIGGVTTKNGLIPPDEVKAAQSESIKVYEDDSVLVVIPLTERAAGFCGRESEWCTAWGYKWGLHPTRKSLFSNYNSEGSRLLIFLDKTQSGDEQQSFQCYYGDNAVDSKRQIMDILDVESVGNEDLENYISRLSDQHISLIIKNCFNPKKLFKGPYGHYEINDGHIVQTFPSLSNFIEILGDRRTRRAANILLHGEYFENPGHKDPLARIIKDYMPDNIIQSLREYINLKYPADANKDLSKSILDNDESEIYEEIIKIHDHCFELGVRQSIDADFSQALQEVGIKDYHQYLEGPITITGPTVKEFMCWPTLKGTYSSFRDPIIEFPENGPVSGYDTDGWARSDFLEDVKAEIAKLKAKNNSNK